MVVSGILVSLWYCRNYTPVAVALKTFDLEYLTFILGRCLMHGAADPHSAANPG